MAKLFLITYSEASLPKGQLVALFDKKPGVLTWFSQISGSFFIKTDDSFTAEKISGMIDEKFGPKKSHVVIRIYNTLREDYWGRLSKELWDHFK